MQTLANFIQSWLNESEKPLVDLYQYLCILLLSIITFTKFYMNKHRIHNQHAKQKDLQISGYDPCKSFNIGYWKDYSNNQQEKKQVISGKNVDIDKPIVLFIQNINRNYRYSIWLIQQRIPSLLAHLNCRIYTRISS
ncbi:unnamed protein product [Rotaria sordida]|uniref:Transmembrane protein n=1 Tax=Rotaria sordida TaxID=392033 RepID=A0A815QCX3_9BILA|nr:unnamed protein product [Rotaria sordida]CAF1641998.1 unnamed protein product [Rotaria sordida]